MKVVEAKIVMLGAMGVGKTSMAIRYIGRMRSNQVSPTIGASFFTCDVTLTDTKVRMLVWDTAGQERFRSMAPMYYRYANAAFLVFDITLPKTFDAIKDWVEELRNNAEEPMVLSLVGNKADLALARTVSASDAAEYAASVGAQYFEVSVLEDRGVDQVFLSTASELIQMYSNSGNTLPTMRTYDSFERGDSFMVRGGLPPETRSRNRGTRSFCC